MGLTYLYKIRLAQLAYKVYSNITPASMSHIIEKTANKYKLRNAHKVKVPRFNTYYMKSSVTYRSSVIWNVILTEFKHLETNINTFIKKCKEKKILRGCLCKNRPVTLKLKINHVPYCCHLLVSTSWNHTLNFSTAVFS
jgi:hypothetical protein